MEPTLPPKEPSTLGKASLVLGIASVVLVFGTDRWGTTVGDIRHDAACHQTGDGDIDVEDVMLVATHWREM